MSDTNKIRGPAGMTSEEKRKYQEVQMKENVPTPETVSTPPPLTPKDSLSVEVEEIRKHHENWVISRFIPLYGLKMVGRLLDMVDDGQEENLKLCLIIAALPDASRYKKLLDQLEAAQAQLRRKDEALEKVKDWACCQLSNRIIVWDREVAPLIDAALDDGKEGGK